MKNVLCPLSIAVALIVAPASSYSAAAPSDAALAARVNRVLAQTPLIDGHNDLPWQIRECFVDVDGVDLRASTANLPKPAKPPEGCEWGPLMTDIPRLRAGHVGGQFWSVWIPSSLNGAAAIQTTLEQIDVVHAMAARYPNDLQMAYTADDIVRIHKAGKIASLIGIEGGHQIGNSLPALRQMYALGARYMTLTHTLNNDWADSATANPLHHGLTAFGRALVHEMNRLGMLVDLSHVSPETMRDVLAVSKTPVIFSHSDARALADHPRNVPDDILRKVAENGGVVMVNFYVGHLSEPYRQWSAEHSAEQARLESLDVGQPDIRKAELAKWEQAHPAPKADIGLIADHIDHVVKIAGHDHVGLGGDLDGIGYDEAPPGMNSVAGYPLLFAELIRRGWSDRDLAKLAGGNVLRVMRQAEAVAASMKNEPPATATLEPRSATDPWK